MAWTVVAWGEVAWGEVFWGEVFALVALAADVAAWLAPADDAVVAAAPEVWAVGVCGWLALALGVDRLGVLAARGDSASVVNPRAPAVAARWLDGAGVGAGATGACWGRALAARDCAKPSAS